MASASSLRITPAYAGKRGISSAMSRSCEDHPCVCGEKYSFAVYVDISRGSPLRMRGKASECFIFRLTSMDHPCVCGEKYGGPPFRNYPQGSPLRMRGKVWGSTISQLSSRITPAYAGKSYSIPHIFQPQRDHPCVCGEKIQTENSRPSKPGSPLRMRGKVPVPCEQADKSRITPAYAGKSRT